MEHYRGRNDLDLSFADFDLGSRVVGFLAYSREYLNFGRTTISLYYNGQSGQRFSWIYNENVALDDQWEALGDLLYIPNYENDINLVDIGSPGDDDYVSAAQQWAELDAHINSEPYLKENRGKYAERNGDRLDFEHNFDFKLIQDFFIEAGGRRHTLQITFDIFNVANLLNHKWGRKYYANNDQIELISHEGRAANGTASEFTFVKPSGDLFYIDDSGLSSSRWQAQLGVRYIF